MVNPSTGLLIGSELDTVRHELAQSREDNKVLRAALARALPWLGRMIVDGGHLACCAPNDAIGAMEQATAALYPQTAKEAQG
jgi:hypothetical protein